MTTERHRQSPRAATFTSKSKSAAVALCRKLTAAGLTWERFWTRNSPLKPNTFRTYAYGATPTLPARFTVRYQDQTPGARISPPRNPGRPKSDKLPETCANAKAGCQRPRVYLDGYCKRCHDRREYWANPEMRERKRLQALANGRKRRAKRREAA
mgnify:FL=1